VTTNDALLLKAARRDATAKFKIFWGFELSCSQTQCRFI